MDSFNATAYYTTVFRSVLAEYEKCSKERRLTSLTPYAPNPDSSTANPRTPLPNCLDYKADVELAAKAALSAEHMQFFVLYYLDQDDEMAMRYLRRNAKAIGFAMNEQDFRRLCTDIRVRLGREFKARSIYPTSTYLYAPSKDGSRRNCRCGDKSHSASSDSDVWCQGKCNRNMAHHEPSDWVISVSELKLWCPECAAKVAKEVA